MLFQGVNIWDFAKSGITSCCTGLEQPILLGGFSVMKNFTGAAVLLDAVPACEHSVMPGG